MVRGTFTLTLCECAENHVNMEQIGDCDSDGYSYEDLLQVSNFFEELGAEVEIYDLAQPLYDIDETPEDTGYLLVVKNGVDWLVPNGSKKLYRELHGLEWDKKALMYGRVVNKRARYNLCFSNYNQEPEYENGKGRVVCIDDLPILSALRHEISRFSVWHDNMVAEGNYYYDNTCGIGYHGDAERKKVIGVRVGDTMPLVYQWYRDGNRIGEKQRYDLENGDIYIMSEKATGNDFKKRKIYTLRHAAGADKYIN